MKNKILYILIFIFFPLLIFSNDKNSINDFTFNFTTYITVNNNNFLIQKYKKDKLKNKKDTIVIDEEEIEKSKIFDKPDFSWFKEKNRGFKLMIAIGAITLAVGFSILLAGIINLLVPLNAVSIDGEPIDTNRYVAASLIGVGGGVMCAGIPLVIVGSVKLGKKRKTNKQENSDPEL